MLRADFGKKCIIVHFLGMEKDGKDERRDAEKRFEEAKLGHRTNFREGRNKTCRQDAGAT
jgi:hypothetical protein